MSTTTGLPASRAFRHAPRKSFGHAKRHDRLDEFIESASRGLDLPLVYQLDNERELIVLVNMLQVTESLASRLGELEEVQYAELNQIMQHMGVSNT